jgi:FKBP-type peptidyl-prolyl cis-trans isomerase FkpA
MKELAIVFLACLLVSVTYRAGYSQGAAQAVRGAAQRLENQVQNQQLPLGKGPEDRLERLSPGKVDPDAQREFQTTRSGLKYRVLRKSDKEKPKSNSTVEVHYKGWLDDNRVFDSSYRRAKPLTAPLGKLIPGWIEGLQLVGQGGMIELEIPPELGYGSRGTPGGPIPPNARLHFIMELISFQ